MKFYQEEYIKTPNIDGNLITMNDILLELQSSKFVIKNTETKIHIQG